MAAGHVNENALCGKPLHCFQHRGIFNAKGLEFVLYGASFKITRAKQKNEPAFEYLVLG